jgi:SAM-dependent MidA family methyltransferase
MLKEKIVDKISRTGPISFHDFMDMALYDPDGGYYTTSTNCIGASGDFYTSASLGSVFGCLIGRQLEEMWQLLGKKEFTIVEYGAGTGLLCHDILSYLQNNPTLYKSLKYYIIERSPVMRQKQKTLLGENVCWLESITEIAPFSGCVFSNELVDNFPVHQVVMQDELAEIFVDHDFKETLKPASLQLTGYFKELGIALPEGFRTEVNLAATTWIKEVAESLGCGFVMTIDYGYQSAELYSPSHREGTVLCYHRHSMYDNPYLHIGEQDITAHVNFSALHHWGLQNGLLCSGFTNQAQFLLSLGLEQYLSQCILSDPRKYIYLKQKLLLEMGTRFKVLVQHKNTAACTLTGLAHSYPGFVQPQSNSREPVFL